MQSCGVQGTQGLQDAGAAERLLLSKAELLRECVGLGIGRDGCLTHLPVLCAPATWRQQPL